MILSGPIVWFTGDASALDAVVTAGLGLGVVLLVLLPVSCRKPFHAYDKGNLDWNAACEVEAATLALTLRYWPREVKEGRLKAEEAQRRVMPFGSTFVTW